LFFGVIGSFHIRRQFEANCEWQTSVRLSQPDRAQRDDEQIRHSRVRAESIATVIPSLIGSSRADEPNGRANAPARIVSVIRCTTGPRITLESAFGPHGVYRRVAQGAGSMARTRFCKAVRQLERHADEPKIDGTSI
jgi:hypothetical protein